jgi:AcrR family transcriptional regulator
MAGKARASRARKKPDRYHHGDLPRALLREAVHTIQRHGVEALTLRGVGDRLGVSRTALYRHFANKQALLASVAGEGFRTLRRELDEAWTAGGRGAAGFDAMGHAYVRFAVRHPSHYRVMFGRYLSSAHRQSVDDKRPGSDPDESMDAFGVLVAAIVEQQRRGIVRQDDPQRLAMYIWSVVHGVAMLALDRILESPEQIEDLTRFAIERIRTGIRREPS